MKIVFFSNFLNHHQLPLCEEFCKKEDVDFTFVATEAIAQERLKMGYADMNKVYDFVLPAYDSEKNMRKAMELAKNCDVMIFGAAPLSYLDIRIAQNKLTFYFCERSLKKGYWRRFIPMTYKKIYNAYLRYKTKPLYVLGASAYASYDLKLCGFDEKKCFKWGYFPKVHAKDLNTLLSKKRKNEAVEILWAGRLLHWKRALDIVKAVHLLVEKDVENFHLTIIGEGEQKKNIQAYIQKCSLQNYVTLLPFMPAYEVRQYMDKTDIYVFSSDFYEGWGAVVNEAMDSACAMLVSYAVGSAPYLIEDGKNGFLYEYGNICQLSNRLARLILDRELREGFAVNGYNTITRIWTSQMAAERLLQCSAVLLQGDDAGGLFESGVCSLAEPLKNNWLKGKI